MRTSGLVICNESYLFILYRTQLLWMLFFTLFQRQFLLPLRRQCHEMDIFLGSKHFNQCFLFTRWWVSRAFNSFSPLFTSINFLVASIQDLLVLSSHWMHGKCTRINLSQAASRITDGIYFQCQNRRFRVFEAGYSKDFQILYVILKEQAKTLCLIFSTTKKPKIVKTINACTESTIY
jgi:hypothetical protein